MTAAVNSPSIPAAEQSAEETIAMLREQIDALDEALLRIVAERARVSRRIQSVRMSSGGTRVELGRERTVRAGYRDALGDEGPALAEAVLQVCRGAR
jgi:chorismate mutase